MGILVIALGLVLAAIPFVVPKVVEEVATTQLEKLGFPFDVKMKLGYCWMSTGPGIRGALSVSIPGSAWKIDSDFSAALCQWHANVRVAETPFNEKEKVISKLLTEHSLTAVSNLTFSGTVALTASVHRTFSLPIAQWNVKTRLSDFNADAILDDKPLTIESFGVAASASGLGSHADIDPFFPRCKKVSAANFTLTNVFAVIRATEKALLVTEASAAFWGGRISLYSVFLDPQKLNAGLTLFLDDIDAGEALTILPGFKGLASGRLHGKTKLFLVEGGKAVRIRDAFLYSTPGEVGKLQVEDTEQLASTLEMAGVDKDNRENVAKALTDLDYSVLRLNLSRQNETEASLGIRVEGQATRKGISVPVTLAITVHGALEQLINTGLQINNAKKGPLQ